MTNQLNLHYTDPNHFNTANDVTRKENKNYSNEILIELTSSKRKIDAPNYFFMFTPLIYLIFDELINGRQFFR